MIKKYFGTDGIRAKVGEANMNPEFALKLAYAAGLAFKENWTKNKRPLVLIGKDTRISGYLIESALEAGFSAAGIDVALLGPIPTPAVAYLTRTFYGCAGVVVSASHNPYYDNGIKFFSGRGRKLDDYLENRIESYLDKYINHPIKLVDSMFLGKARRINDARGRYIEHCKSSIPTGLELNGLKVVVDCANGATYQVGPSVFKELGANVIAIHNEPNGHNINKECGSTDIKLLAKKVLDSKADLGISFDGDGDRVILIDDRGQEINGDAILYIIARGRIHKGEKPAGIVGTVMTNLGTINAIKSLGIDFKPADVGDRYVMELLNASDWLLGGESSGHIICLDKSTTGDGIIAALQILETLQCTGLSLTELLKDYSLYPMRMVNVKVKDKKAIMQDSTLISEMKQTNEKLKKSGRLLIRPSGTEPKIRIMVEAKQHKIVDNTIMHFVNLVKKIGENYA